MVYGPGVPAGMPTVREGPALLPSVDRAMALIFVTVSDDSVTTVLQVAGCRTTVSEASAQVRLAVMAALAPMIRFRLSRVMYFLGFETVRSSEVEQHGLHRRGQCLCGGVAGGRYDERHGADPIDALLQRIGVGVAPQPTQIACGHRDQCGG